MTQPGFLVSSFYVAAGGATGAWLRFAAGRLITAGQFPAATLAINVAGSFAMGLLAGWLARQGQHAGAWQAESWRLLLGVGLLGGFTTFSAFSLEIVQLMQRGALFSAATYVILSLAGGILGLVAGLAAMRVAA
jgi:CrcB protein